MSFRVLPGALELHGRPFQVLSGAIHYFRVHPRQWADRLGKLRAMGLNTIETYVPWNLHEPIPGKITFDGPADIEGFLSAAAHAGLYAIVRPGPYICAEWDNGGLPAWLRAEGEIPLRCHDPRFLAPVDRYFDQLIPRVAAHQITRGGNVIMVQVENEFGSYGSDPQYLRHLADGLVRRGIDVPLFTSDGPTDLMLSGGTLDGVYATANFGSRVADQFDAMARLRPGPEFCMEYWNGWFDHYGEDHSVRDAAEAALTLDQILTRGASVNIYMAHGGTSFGFSAGANAGGDHHDGVYQPNVTSYDYDAPVAEHGALTPKFWAYREVLGRHSELPGPPAPEDPPVLAATTVHLDERLSLLDCLDRLSAGSVATAAPPTFEELGQAHGIAVYRTRIPSPRVAHPLRVTGLRDRAQVLVGGAVMGVLERDHITSIPVAPPGSGTDLTLVVEAMGRVNYGPLVGERKGLTGGVYHGQQRLQGWQTSPVPLADLTALPWGRETRSPGPSFHRGHLNLDEVRDTFLALPGWHKGYLWVNGFNLGRYWHKGPQTTLYVPWPVLRAGANEIIVLELDGAPALPAVDLRERPELGTPAQFIAP
ncbi:glycoside hydrolase family 35 protein [Micromonospora sp. LZ34]